MRRRSFIMLAGLASITALTGFGAALTDGAVSCANAEGNSCVSACRAAHSDCRIRTKGSASCDAQFQACMQGCVKR
ncbi:MAG: hypothetical protein ABL904_15265 [Hyphomicrobiaceae bacterium]